MTAYYNEIDPFAAAWLRNLIAGGHIAPGDVDERSIVDVRATDLVGYSQCHFFAGIGGWSLALRLAGVSDDAPIWTGSCPCQPLSSAGRQRGHADERHLWPAFHALIAQCRPATVFGEQVASKDGREWFAGVRADLEGTGYACGAADLCAAGAGAPHIRQRLYWVGQSDSTGKPGEIEGVQGRAHILEPSRSSGGLADASLQRERSGADQSGEDGRSGQFVAGAAPGRNALDGSCAGGLGNADDTRPQGRDDRPGGGWRAGQLPAGPTGVAGGMADGTRERLEGRTGEERTGEWRLSEQLAGGGISGGLADAGRAGDERGRGPGASHGTAGQAQDEARQRQRGGADLGHGGEPGGLGDADDTRLEGQRRHVGEHDAEGWQEPQRHAGPPDFWDAYDLVPCSDGKTRRTGPGIFPLAHGVPARVGRLRAYGNAIVPQVAAAFIEACLDA